MSRAEMVVEPVLHPWGIDVLLALPREPTVVVRWRTNRSCAPVAVTDMLVPLALLPAMRIGVNLRIEADISARLLENVERIQRIYWSWDPSLCLVDVQATSAVRFRGSDQEGAFFSGGVDSFHTALRHRITLASLIFVAGFDIGHRRKRLLDTVSAANRRAADSLGLELTHVSTDLREFTSPYLSWSEYHGAALAAAAHLCGFGRTYIPGSLSLDSTFPYGSHPDLDPLYGSEAATICYDGYETNRVTKTIEIADSDLVLELLRVCNTRDDLGYNCGRCEKCLRTLAALRIAGRRGRIQSFPVELDPAELAGRRFRQGHDLWRQNLRAAIACGDTELADAIDALLARPAP